MHSIVISDGVIVTTLEGSVTVKELRGIREEIRDLAGFAPDLPRIVNTSGATFDEIPTAALQDLMREPGVIGGTLIIVAPETATFGLARMSQIVASGRGHEFTVVRSMQEAHKALSAGQR